jgi:tetratricopeptide (TPR) repeat protein
MTGTTQPGGGGKAGTARWLPTFHIAPGRSAVLLTAAAMLLVAFISVARLITNSGAPGDYETRQGDIRLGHGEYAAALQRFDAALAVAPDHAGAAMGRALALMQSGQLDAAEAQFDRLIGLLPANAGEPAQRSVLAVALANRGILRDRAGRHHEALADYEAALRADPAMVEGPGLVDRVLSGTPRASSVADRARYLREQLALPETARRLSVPALDAKQPMHKP